MKNSRILSSWAIVYTVYFLLVGINLQAQEKWNKTNLK